MVNPCERARTGYAPSDQPHPVAPEAAFAASSFGCVVVADVERPPIKDGSLDGVVMECVLSLLPDKQGALSRAHRALRPDGRIAVSDVTIEQPLPLGPARSVGVEHVRGRSAPHRGVPPVTSREGFRRGPEHLARRRTGRIDRSDPAQGCAHRGRSHREAGGTRFPGAGP